MARPVSPAAAVPSRSQPRAPSRPAQQLVYLPPYTPELQPAETLWAHVDEPIVNTHFETLAELDSVVADRCLTLGIDRNLVRGQTGFHWWPQRVSPI